MYTWLCRILSIVFLFQTIAPQILQARDTYQMVQEKVRDGRDDAYMRKVSEIDQEFLDWRRVWLKEGDFDLNDPEDREIFDLLETQQLQRVKMLKILWFDRIFFDGRHSKLWENYHSASFTYNKKGLPSEKSVCKLYNTIKDLHVQSAWMDKVETEFHKKELSKAYTDEMRGLPGAKERQAAHLLPNFTNFFITSDRLARSIESGSMGLEDFIEYIDPWKPEDVNLSDMIAAAEIWGNTLDGLASAPPPIEAEEGEEGFVWNQEVFNQELDELLLKLQLRVAYRLSHLKALSYKSDELSIKAAGTLHILLLKIRNFYKAQNRPNPLESKVYPCGLNYSVSGPYSEADVSSLFYKQVQAFSRTGYDDQSLEYAQFVMLLDYAVAYGVTQGNMGNIESYVKILNASLKKKKYKQRLSGALEHLFLFWYENIRYNNNIVGQNINDTLLMFHQFTDKEQYALPTRIFALEVLSRLAYNQNGEDLRQYMKEKQIQLGMKQTFYNYRITDEWRDRWGQLVADIYCPLVSENRYYMEDYGLNSEQMKLLAEKLSFIYAWFVRQPPADPNAHNLWSGTYTTNQCTVVVGKNSVNGLKKKKEMDNMIFRFFAEALFWVYGGEVLAFVGTAFRVTRGAAIAAPKAVKAFALAKRGRRGMAFAVEVQKGMRMANLSKNLTRNGVRINAVRSTAKPGQELVVKGASQETFSSAKMATETVNMSKKHTLRNQYSKWSPRYWMGKEPGRVLEYQVTQQTPGFGANVGVLSGAKLPNGIRSYQDWRVFRSNLLDVSTGGRMTFNTYSFAEQQLLRSEAYLTHSVGKMGKSGAFDVWVPHPDGRYYSLRSLSSENEIKPLLTQYMTNPAEGLLITSRVVNRAPVLNSLEGLPGVRVSLPELMSGAWHSRVASEIYQPLDWGGTVSNLLMPRFVPKHVGLFEAPVRMQSAAFHSASLTHGMLQSSKFFLGVDIWDRMLKPSFNKWRDSTAQKELDKILAHYSDVFDPKLLQEDAQYAQEVLDAVKEQGFDTTPVNPIYEEIAWLANPLTEHEGVSVSFPLLSAWHYSSKLPFAFWNSPFQSPLLEQRVKMQATELQINRLVRKYQQTQDRQLVDSFIQESLAANRKKRESWMEQFTLFKQFLPGDWTKDEADFLQTFDSFEKEVRATSGIENIGKRVEHLNRINKKYDGLLNGKIEKLNIKIKQLNARQLEESIRELLSDLQRRKENYQEDLEQSLYETDLSFPVETCTPWVERYHQLADKYIRRLEALRRGGEFNEEKKTQIVEAWISFLEEEEQLAKEVDVWRTLVATQRELQPDESSDISTQP